MYGEPLQPNRTGFDIGIFSGQITISVSDLDELDNDDVREVVHPDFETYWGNEMENVFSTEHFKTMREAIDWCVSIGMIFQGVNMHSETESETKTVCKYEQCSIVELKKLFAKSIDEEEYEKSSLINAELKKRNL